MNKKEKILIIAYSFPPIPFSGTYRILRFCKGITEMGYSPFVMTINIDDNIPNDNNLMLKVPDLVKIIRTPIFDPWRKYQKWKKQKQGKSGYRVINKIISNLLRLISIPDHQVFWIPFAVYQGLKLIKKNKIKTVMVSSPPNSSLIIGLILKMLTNIKFVADLRDPIVGNVAQVHLIRPKDMISRFEKKVLESLEKLIVKNADIVITNTQTHSREMKANYRVDKFPTIRNSFDEDDYKGLLQDKYSKLTIAHTGAMYGRRNADILFNAIKKLEHELKPEPLNLQVLFVGNVDNSVLQAIENAGVGEYVKLVGRVSHKEAIQFMVKSHLLLLVKATGEGSLGQIPAKYFEYVGAGNKIIYIGPGQSEVAGLIKEYNQGYIFEDDEVELVDSLKAEYKKYLNGESVSIDQCDLFQFGSRNMSEKIIEILKQ